MRMWALAAVVSLGIGGPVLAQGPITTAPSAGPTAPQPTAAAAPLGSADAVYPQEQPVAFGPCGPEKVKPDGTLETKPHGEVEAGIGTGGYRHVAGVVCQPIGQKGSVTVGVSSTQDNERYRRR